MERGANLRRSRSRCQAPLSDAGGSIIQKHVYVYIYIYTYIYIYIYMNRYIYILICIYIYIFISIHTHMFSLHGALIHVSPSKFQTMVIWVNLSTMMEMHWTPHQKNSFPWIRGSSLIELLHIFSKLGPDCKQVVVSPKVYSRKDFFRS